MKKNLWVLVIIAAIFLSAVNVKAEAGVRIKDVANISGLEDLQIYGYGLVVGLDGTGDRSQTVFTAQTVINMLKNMGIELPDKQLKVQNVAAVMVTGTVKPFKRKGTRFDVNVSSMGDAVSLEGGTLLLTTMQGADGTIYASAQGPLATGGYDTKYKSLVRIKKNHVLVGRIPDGAIVQKEYSINVLDSKDLSLSLTSPDFTSAVAMAKAINMEFKSIAPNIAKATDPATVSLNPEAIIRDSLKNYAGLVDFISKVENVKFDVASQARVVVNERTGTIVAGGDVRISEVAVSQGSIKVEVVNTPEVVQPVPYNGTSSGYPVSPSIAIEEKTPEMVVLKGTTTVSDLSQALNSLGVSPRDVISIFQAIKEAGALQGQLIIM